MKKLKCLLILPKNDLFFWQKTLIDALSSSQLLEITSFARVEPKLKKADGLFQKILRKKRRKEYFLQNNLEVDLSKIPQVNSLDISADSCDFVLNLTPHKFNIFPRWGIWQFEQSEFSDPFNVDYWARFFGSNSGFQSIRLLAYTNSDASKLLFEGATKKYPHSYFKTLDHALASAINFPLRAIREILISKKSSLEEFKNFESIDKKIKATGSIFQGLIYSVWFYFADLLRSEFFEEVWGVGVLKRPVQSFLKESVDPKKVNWYVPDKKITFLADPFGFDIGKSLKIYMELFEGGKGNIVSVDYKKEGIFLNYREEIKLNNHLSYPFLFSHKGQNFCMPENAESGKLSIYSVNKDFTLEKISEILPGLNILDATMIFYKEKWWLFCSLVGNESLENLYIYYSEDLNGDWASHSLNPVKTDIRSARPAGPIFFQDEALYRPSQNCAKTYGGGLSISKIEELTPDSFSETVVGTHDPIKSGPYPHGFHTLSSVGSDYTLIDGKRFVFALRKALGYPLRILMRK